MGGHGSGMCKHPSRKREKDFVESFNMISPSMLPLKEVPPNDGIEVYLHGMRALVLPDHLEFRYGIGEGQKTLRIQFALSKNNYKHFRERYWLRCQKCERRCTNLYVQQSFGEAPSFLCKDCCNLAYRSQNTSHIDRLIDRKWEVLRELESTSDIVTKKPKWMHWSTFYRLRDEVDELDRQITCGIGGLFGLYGSK